MIKITVCIGSACHLKGSRQVVERIQQLIEEKNLGDKIELAGAFCMGKCCEEGVNVCVDEQNYSVVLDKVDEFFEEKVLKAL